MTDPIFSLNSTQLQPGVQQRLASTSRSSSSDSRGPKPGVNVRQARKSCQRLMILVALSLSGTVFAAQTQDAEYEAVAEEYVKTYLAAHPLQGTALGLHEYDGKISDYSRLALDAELSRLRR